MNSKQIGTKAEKDVVKILEFKGYLVMRSPRTMRQIFVPGRKPFFVSQDNDYFNCFDVCATNNTSMKWIQVKQGIKHTAEAKHKIEKIESKFNGHNCLQVWEKIPRKGFVIHSFLRQLGWTKEFIDLKGNICVPFTITEKKNE